jgi:hypothetical protein
VADEVANAMLVKRSIKAIPNNIPWFLVIVTDLHKFNKNDSRKKSKSFYIL